MTEEMIVEYTDELRKTESEIEEIKNKRLENARKEDSFSQGRFYMITDHQAYVNKSTQGGLGSVFTTHDGAETQANHEFYYRESKSKHNVKVELKNPYLFEWEKIDKKSDKKEEWYFLELKV